jgi:beta-mannanase
MNGNWYPWAVGVNGNSSGDYINAWRHVHGIFEAEGADNVQWIWSPNRDYPGATALNTLYPGDEYADWVGIDGYNFGTEKSGMSWRSFNETFKGTYDIVTGLSSRPVMIGETGSTETGGDKAAWIREGLSPENLAANFPRLKALIYFNQVGSGNWPLSTSQSATRAFAETVQAWLEYDAGDAAREEAQEPAPTAEPQGPTQAGRARVSGSQDPRELAGAWSGFKR